MVFLPMILFFGFFGFLALVVKLVFQAKDQVWVGEVIDKSHVVKDKYDSNLKEHLYSYKVKLENGETHNIAASLEFFNQIKIGDRLKKDKGALWPKKI